MTEFTAFNPMLRWSNNACKLLIFCRPLGSAIELSLASVPSLIVTNSQKMRCALFELFYLSDGRTVTTRALAYWIAI
jgi:hypothetical protein